MYSKRYNYRIVTKNQGIITGDVKVFDSSLYVRDHILNHHCLSPEDVRVVYYSEYVAPSVLSRVNKASQRAFESALHLVGRSVVSIVRAISNIKTSHRKV